MASSPASAASDSRTEYIFVRPGENVRHAFAKKNSVPYPVYVKNREAGVIRGMILPEIVPEMMFMEDGPAMQKPGSTL